MRCIMCERLMLVAAVTIPTKGGPIGYGPKCAERAGLLQRKKRGPLLMGRTVRRVENGQEDWIMAAQAAAEGAA